jgi:hypothetical protein
MSQAFAINRPAVYIAITPGAPLSPSPKNEKNENT